MMMIIDDDGDDEEVGGWTEEDSGGGTDIQYYIFQIHKFVVIHKIICCLRGPEYKCDINIISF